MPLSSVYLLEDNLFSVKKWKPVLSPHGNYSLCGTRVAGRKMYWEEK